MKNIIKYFFVILFFGLTITVVKAEWVGPTDTPSNANRPRPVDISSDPQTKAGALTVQGLLSGTAGLDFTTTGVNNAVYGHGAGNGVVGYTTAANTYAGVYGQATAPAWAGYFAGPLGTSGSVTASAGSAGAPSYLFSNDNDTGIYSSAVGAINFSTNGTSRFQVYSTGPVGVAYRGSSTTPSYLFTADTNTGMGSTIADTLNFLTGGAERLRIDSAGNTIVRGQLRVIGGAPGAGKVLTSDANGLATWANPAAGSAAGSDTQVQFNNGGSFAGDSNFTYSNGNVGLGLAAGVSPAVRLDVNGAIRTGGGYNGTGITIGNNGNILTKGDLTVDGMTMLGANSLNLTNTQNLLYGNIGSGSAAGSNLLLLQNNDSDKFKINKDGQTTILGGVTAAAPTSQLNFSDYFDNSGNPSISHINLFGNQYGFGVSANDLDIFAPAYVRFSSTDGTPAYDTVIINTDIGIIRSGSGSVGAPAYSFVADTNTGIYRSQTDTLNFATNGVNRMSIDSAGNAAINGTTTVKEIKFSATGPNIYASGGNIIIRLGN